MQLIVEIENRPVSDHLFSMTRSSDQRFYTQTNVFEVSESGEYFINVKEKSTGKEVYSERRYLDCKDGSPVCKMFSSSPIRIIRECNLFTSLPIIKKDTSLKCTIITSVPIKSGLCGTIYSSPIRVIDSAPVDPGLGGGGSGLQNFLVDSKFYNITNNTSDVVYFNYVDGNLEYNQVKIDANSTKEVSIKDNTSYSLINSSGSDINISNVSIQFSRTGKLYVTNFSGWPSINNKIYTKRIEIVYNPVTMKATNISTYSVANSTKWYQVNDEFPVQGNITDLDLSKYLGTLVSLRVIFKDPLKPYNWLERYASFVAVFN